MFLAYSLQLTAYSLHADDRPSSAELLNKAWAAHGKNDPENTFKYTGELIALYKEKAGRQQASLKELPRGRSDIEAVPELNDVATAYFIQAESYMRQQKVPEAKKTFQLVIDKYPYAQAWDQRGWFWQVAEASRQSIKKLETGSIEIEKKRKVSQLPTKVALHDPGKEDFVDYALYGEFRGAGTKDYKYIIKDQEGLSAAVGEGVYPNTTAVRWDPAFKKALKEGRLNGSHWDFLQSPDLEAAFLKWATAPEPEGVKLFYTAQILEKSGLIKQALKCYYAIVVHFPSSYGWTYWHTPWYIGQAAIAKIEFLLRRNPQLGYELVGADIKVAGGHDNKLANDSFLVDPGRLVKIKPLENISRKLRAAWAGIRRKIDRGSLSISRRLGKGRVRLEQYEDGGWQMLVDGKPYTIKGVTYAPTKVGQSPDDGTMSNWMEDDFNRNGRIDGPYDSFVDKNKNNRKDWNEPVVGDFKLMKEMGVNTIRVYHQPFEVNKELLRELYRDYGIMVIMGDFLGKYAIGSGAPWDPGTDYNNPQHKKNMIQSVTNMVLEFKDEPFILMWLLGNENVYGYACNADKEPEAFFKFANEAALAVKAIDPEHPVGISNGDVLYLDRYAKYAPDIDVFGANAYRGGYGFGRFWLDVREKTGRPAFITEYGCPAYAESMPAPEAEELQADYHRAAWEDMRKNMAFSQGAGNCIGGVIFEWLDEWWKAYEPRIHDTKGLFTGPFPDGYMHEEWLGLCGQGDGSLSPFLRQLRESYYTYKKLWR